MRKHHIWTRNFSVKENKPVNFRVLTRIYFVNIMTWSVYKINRVILLSTDLKLWRSESLPEAIWIGCLNSVLWLLVTVEIRQQEKNLYMKKIHLPSIIIWTKLPLNLYSKLQLSLVQANSNLNTLSYNTVPIRVGAFELGPTKGRCRRKRKTISRRH